MAVIETESASAEPPPLYDVIIVGAGPCGLAVAARLCEHTPSALFTDEEHQRYHWIRKHGKKMSIMKGKNGCVILPKVDDKTRNHEPGRKPDSNTNVASGPGPPYKTLVLDATADKWMANWNRLFSTFGITHLRSPMFFHVDPRDRDGLLSFTYEQDRKQELREIANCVGKETSKHRKKKQMARMAKELGKGPKARLEIDERDRKDYFAPSRSLFGNHCECIVNRYGLNKGLVRHERVQDIDFDLEESISETDEVFTITTDKTVYHARAVVIAVGAGNAPTIPYSIKPELFPEGMCHSNQIKEFPASNVKRKIQEGKETNVLVVGGGLTSAQLDDLAIRKGVKKVWHIMRGDFKVKPFDVNLEWMGKFQNHEKAVFWSADSDEERLQQIRVARNGGSITPFYEKLLKSLVAEGSLSINTSTSISQCEYDRHSRTFTVTTDPEIANLPAIDYIYFATGVDPHFERIPFLQNMLQKYPLHGHGGFPCLSEDLMWRGTVTGSTAQLQRAALSKVDKEMGLGERGRDRVDKRIPLFVAGRLASLRLGPGAGNLEGARIGAERIAWALQEVLDEPLAGATADPSHTAGGDSDDATTPEEQTKDESAKCAYRYCAAIGSRFEILQVDNQDTE